MLSKLLSKALTTNCMKSSKTKTPALLRAVLAPAVYKPPVKALIPLKPVRNNALDTLNRVNRNVQIR